MNRIPRWKLDRGLRGFSAPFNLTMASKNNSKRNVRGKPRQGGALTLGDYNTKPIHVPGTGPPARNVVPMIQKTVRLMGSFSAGSGTPYIFIITPINVAAGDSADYGTAGPRYSQVRFERVKSWVSSGQRSDPGVAATGVLTPQSVLLTTGNGVSDYLQLQDQYSSGSDFASLGMKFDVQTAASWISTTATTQIVTLTILADPGLPVAVNIYGNWTMDVTVGFR